MMSWLIQNGSTCWNFATTNGITLTDLISLNPSINCPYLPINTYICVQLPSNSLLLNFSAITTAIASPENNATCPLYTIQPGDTWTSIAKTVNILPSILMSENPQIISLLPGQLIIFPCNQISNAIQTTKEEIQQETNRLVIYTTSWAQYRTSANGRETKCNPYAYTPNHINPSIPTHVNYAFVVFDGQGNVQNYEWDDGTLINQLVSLKAKNSNLKTLVSIGGWTFCQNSTVDPFSKIANSDTLASNFATSAVQYARKYNLDGIDIDWEFPSASDDFTGLLTALRNAITIDAKSTKKAPLLLTAALPAGIPDIVNINVSAVSSLLDYANIIAYDYHGGSFETWPPLPHTPIAECLKAYLINQKIYFWDIASTLQYYMDNGMPAYMINAGLATYGRTFPSSDGGKLVPGNCTDSPGILSYYEIEWMLNGKSPNIDIFSMTANASTSGLWIGFDTIETHKMKICYYASIGITSVMIFDGEEDDNFTLIDGIYSAINSLSYCNTSYYQDIVSQSFCTGTLNTCIDNNGKPITTIETNLGVVIDVFADYGGVDVTGSTIGVCSMIGSYGRGVGSPISSCSSGLEQSGLLCYPQCNSGYTGAGPMCWGSGWNFFKSYGRGVGKTLSCAERLTYDAGLCYEPCNSGYYGIGPVCWRNPDDPDPNYPINCGQFDLFGNNLENCTAAINEFDAFIALGVVTVVEVGAIFAIPLLAPLFAAQGTAFLGITASVAAELSKIPICNSPQSCT